MDLDKISKYININKVMNGYEVQISGIHALFISGAADSFVWYVNPIFAKIVYGAKSIYDLPACQTSFPTEETAIVDGLLRLYDLGILDKEIDLPDDTYKAAYETTLAECFYKTGDILSNVIDAKSALDVLLYEAQGRKTSYDMQRVLSHARVNVERGLSPSNKLSAGEKAVLNRVLVARKNGKVHPEHNENTIGDIDYINKNCYEAPNRSQNNLSQNRMSGEEYKL